MDHDTYMFHQTPEELCKKLIDIVPLEPGDRVLEPFRGEGGFFNNFPDFVEKDWTEIEQGRDYTSHTAPFDWVISNPPFRLDSNGKRENAFFKLLKYYTERAVKGVAFLGNDYCLATITPKRMKEINETGWFIHSVTTCNVKKWRGRYYFVVWKKQPSNFFGFIDGTF
jgi:type I restriction-modification system DNA methylase subunit